MYAGPIIDCDVHNNPRQVAEYLDYLPEHWRSFVTADDDPSLPNLQAPFPSASGLPDGMAKRHEAYPEDGLPGSNLEMMQEQLLDPFDIVVALLGHDVGQQTGLINGELALAVCRATNDSWLADRWLGSVGDPRLFGAILVPSQTPAEAAAEIRRVGENPRFISALMPFNGLGRPFGHPVYHPIYQAIADMDLPLHMHVSGELFGLTASLASGGGGGAFTYKFEQYHHVNQPTATHIASFIEHGVFEKFPTLKLLLAESGLSWFTWFAERLDSHYGLMRQESVWVKKRPSDYLREHVVVGTQPCETSAQDRDEFLSELTLFDGIEDMLVFTSDYPHWDADDPRVVWSVYPEAWHEKIAFENVTRVLRLPSDIQIPTRELKVA